MKKYSLWVKVIGLQWMNSIDVVVVVGGSAGQENEM